MFGLDQDSPNLVDLLHAYWPIFTGSFIMSLVATPVCKKLALRHQIVDRPDGHLKPHSKAIPYLGGVAIFIGWGVGVLLSIFLFDRASHDQSVVHGFPAIHVSVMVGVFLAGLMVMCLGLFDDLKMASPKVKIFGVTGVTFMLIIFGLGDDTILVTIRSMGIPVSDLHPALVWAYSIPLTVFITLGACNATNLIDGMDGLCSGVLAIIAGGFLVLAVHLHLFDGWRPWDAQRMVLVLAMLGAALGFLPYNRNPAKIFMGDAGSMLLGLNAAVLLLLFAKSNAVRWMLASIMIFGLPIGDMILTLARRWRYCRPLMQGDRSHFYDQLLDRGLSVKRVVAISYGLAGFFALAGCASIFLRTRYVVLIYSLIVVGFAMLVKKLKLVRVEEE